MQVQLYTSLTGLTNRLNGMKMYAFKESSSMRSGVDDIVILVDFDEIEATDDDGVITIKERSWRK